MLPRFDKVFLFYSSSKSLTVYFSSRRRTPRSCFADMVVMGPGCKPGLFFATMALVEPGDEVIIPDPGFPTYTNMIKVAGGTDAEFCYLEAALCCAIYADVRNSDESQ